MNIFTGLRFNLFLYNVKNRYKNKMKEIELKKKSTPRFFFFKNKKNKYVKFSNNIIKTKLKKLPYFLIKRYRIRIRMKKKKKYLKRKKYRFLKCFNYIISKRFYVKRGA
jgi:hypothetical protein